MEQQTLFKEKNKPHDILVAHALKWAMRKGNCMVAAAEVSQYMNREIPDVIGFRYNGLCVIIECKVTRADYLSDKNKSFRKAPETGMGAFRYYYVPEGLVEYNELPDKWGLVYKTRRGSRLIKSPKAFLESNKRSELRCAVKMMRTKYEFKPILK